MGLAIECSGTAPGPKPLTALERIGLKIARFVEKGKGKERHGNSANGELTIEDGARPANFLDTHFPGFLLGQAAKKLTEAQGMGPVARYREVLGAAGYIAIWLLRHEKEEA